jgi:hypothetical protein
LSSKRVESIAEHIRTTVDALNVHDDPRHSRLYTQGFILGHLASIFEQDPILYREFLEHCNQIANTRGRKVDMHRR